RSPRPPRVARTCRCLRRERLAAAASSATRYENAPPGALGGACSCDGARVYAARSAFTHSRTGRSRCSAGYVGARVLPATQARLMFLTTLNYAAIGSGLVMLMGTLPRRRVWPLLAVTGAVFFAIDSFYLRSTVIYNLAILLCLVLVPAIPVHIRPAVHPRRRALFRCVRRARSACQIGGRRTAFQQRSGSRPQRDDHVLRRRRQREQRDLHHERRWDRLDPTHPQPFQRWQPQLVA